MLLNNFFDKNSIKYLRSKQRYKKIINCEICESKNFYNLQNIARVGKVGEYGILNIVICLQCGHKFVNPRFLDDFYIKYYLKKYRKIAFGFEKPTDKYLNIQKKRGQGVINYFKNKISKPGKILDHGCASGGTMIPWIKSGWKAFGFDPHIPSVDFGKKKLGLNIKKCFGEKIDFKSKEFDVVKSLGSLEHSYDINKSLKEINRVLKKNGYLIIRWRSNKIIGSTLEYFNHNHYRYFTRLTWTHLLKKHNFKIHEFVNKKLENYNSYEYILAKKQNKLKRVNKILSSINVIKKEINYVSRQNTKYYRLSKKLKKLNFLKNKSIDHKINFIKKNKKKLLNEYTQQSANRFIYELKKFNYIYEKKKKIG